jgi:integrase
MHGSACRKASTPIEARDVLLRANKVTEARGVTFDKCAEDYIAAHRASWKNAKHADQWKNTLATYASPVFGALPVQAVDTPLVLKVLEPLWSKKTETATRLRGRIENVLDWARVRQYRDGENPARWRGHLDHILPARTKVQKVKHHEAMPYADVAAFLKALRDRPGVTPKALEFIILTACRAGEALASPGRTSDTKTATAATWDEIDFDNAVWTIPAERMKAGREHRVPLSTAALTVLRSLKEEAQNEFVFPGWKTGTPLTIAAPLVLLQRELGYSDLTVHGFRSSFRDWAAEQTNHPREIAEAALAHTLRDKTEAAYQRGDMLETSAQPDAGMGRVLRTRMMPSA